MAASAEITGHLDAGAIQNRLRTTEPDEVEANRRALRIPPAGWKTPACRNQTVARVRAL
jgi:hypothetical protein